MPTLKNRKNSIYTLQDICSLFTTDQEYFEPKLKTSSANISDLKYKSNGGWYENLSFSDHLSEI